MSVLIKKQHNINKYWHFVMTRRRCGNKRWWQRFPIGVFASRQKLLSVCLSAQRRCLHQGRGCVTKQDCAVTRWWNVMKEKKNICQNYQASSCQICVDQRSLTWIFVHPTQKKTISAPCNLEAKIREIQDYFWIAFFLLIIDNIDTWCLCLPVNLKRTGLLLWVTNVSCSHQRSVQRPSGET